MKLNETIIFAVAIAIIVSISCNPTKSTSESDTTFTDVEKQETIKDPPPKKIIIQIPGTYLSIYMNLMEAGAFTMGSSATETGRDKDETQKDVTLDAFYMGIYEVTYDEFVVFQNKEADSEIAASKDYKVDAVTRPTPQYMDYTYGMGRKGGFPAVGMTQQAALRYCQWLYQKTGTFFRLPTEAEWEYACRAGSTTAYHFGDSSENLGKYAYYKDNSEEKYHEVGGKEPNDWGLFDMLGNVAEWTLDDYQEDYATKTSNKNPWLKPTKKHFRTVRGGSFEDKATDLRSAARLKSSLKWQARDPQIPKSKWWNPDSPHVGFRLVSPVMQPSKAEVEAFFEEAIVD